MNFEINTETKTITLLGKVSILRMKQFLFEDLKLLLGGDEDNWTLQYKPEFITIRTKEVVYPYVPIPSPPFPWLRPLGPINPITPWEPYRITCNAVNSQDATVFRFSKP